MLQPARCRQLPSVKEFWWEAFIVLFFLLYRAHAFTTETHIRADWRTIYRHKIPFLPTHQKEKNEKCSTCTATARQSSFDIEISTNSQQMMQEIITKGGLYTPDQILHPSFLGSTNTDTVPLCLAIQLLKQAVSNLMQQANQVGKERARTKGRVSLRIEQQVTQSVDPLAWLHAQIVKSNPPSVFSKNSFPVIYFSNGEDTHEISGIGNSGLTFCGVNSSTLSSEDWAIIERFPSPSMRVYGGARFDYDYAAAGSTKSSEWDRFANGCDYIFTLPALELLRETNHGMKLAINLHFGDDAASSHNGYKSLAEALESIQSLLHTSVNQFTSTTIAPSLPAIIERKDSTTMEKWESTIEKILAPQSSMQKCVLARSMELTLGSDVHPLDIVRKMKYGVFSSGGIGDGSGHQHHRHLFYFCPTGDTTLGAFLGSTPERLFRVQNGMVTSEALAGTRLRGANQESDVSLSQELLMSAKDMSENTLTMDYIVAALQNLEAQGLIRKPSTHTQDEVVFIRRLRHLQHLCRRIERHVTEGARVTDITRMLLDKLHPTPAVCGYPFKHEAMEFIRENEPFDRGFFSGPFGFVGRADTDILVAIRSCLTRQVSHTVKGLLPSTSITLYAGAGIVPGSTPQNEYIETTHKLSVISSLFPPSPFSLQTQPNANAAFSAAFVEELIRNGVAEFFICPGSRSTPLSVAIVRASRQIHRVGSIRLHSCIDERGAIYRAIGYFHRTGKIPAVVTTSGTAVSNLSPGVVEASVGAIPVLIITADRPYEQIGVGADQAIDQVKTFGHYVRFFRDVQPPSNDATVAINCHLSDAAHGLQIAIQQRGPVHFNIQFRENLAPDGENERIRGDPREGRPHKFDCHRYTDVVGWDAWTRGGQPWFLKYGLSSIPDPRAVKTLIHLLQQSSRAILIVGNIRPTVVSSASEEELGFEDFVKTIDLFATTVGMPIVASCQRVGCALRFSSAAVIPFAEYVLGHPTVASSIKPDLIIQLGHPLVGSVSNFIERSRRDSHGSCTHVILHEHYATERATPTMTTDFVFDCPISSILSAVLQYKMTDEVQLTSDELAPLVMLGRSLQSKLPKIILSSPASVEGQSTLTEPQIMLAISQLSADKSPSYFWSNSMPIRDAEAFFYPLRIRYFGKNAKYIETASNRGASGIDGIVSTAQGYASHSGGRHTTLVVGDVAALHDLNALHLPSITPFTTLLVNNGGGSIFSFLPIRNHGESVGFEEFWGTPQTSNVNFSNVARAMGIQHVSTVRTFKELCSTYRKAETVKNNFIECCVVEREENVKVHNEIRRLAHKSLDSLVTLEPALDAFHQHRKKNPISKDLPIRVFDFDPIDRPVDAREEKSSFKLPAGWKMSMLRPGEVLKERRGIRNILFLHGWMGDQSEWDDVIAHLLSVQRLEDTSSWRLITLDMPGHGHTPSLLAPEMLAKRSLNLTEGDDLDKIVSLEWMATSILSSLQNIGLQSLDVVCGYSLGGRVALTMKLLMSLDGNSELGLLSKTTKLILLSANAKELLSETEVEASTEQEKKQKISDFFWQSANRSLLLSKTSIVHWAPFLTKWYRAGIWANLQERRPQEYAKLVSRRVDALQRRCIDLAFILAGCNSAFKANAIGEKMRFDFERNSNVLFVAGALDEKYVSIGRRLRQSYSCFSCVNLSETGHALLVESPERVASLIAGFVFKEKPAMLESQNLNKIVPASFKVNATNAGADLDLYPRQEILVTPSHIDMSPFTFQLTNGDRADDQRGVRGIGWVRNNAADSAQLRQRCGIVIQLTACSSKSEEIIGIGEISPLAGLHSESLSEVEDQLKAIQVWISSAKNVPSFKPKNILSLKGELTRYLEKLSSLSQLERLHPSVASGLEMALISLSSNVFGMSLIENMATNSPMASKVGFLINNLPLNGLLTIDKKGFDGFETPQNFFQSMKIKIGDEPGEDARRILLVAASQRNSQQRRQQKVRADANRAWDKNAAYSFAELMHTSIGPRSEFFEFIEEPFAKSANEGVIDHMHHLTDFYRKTGIAFALDETVYDVVCECGRNWDDIKSLLEKMFNKPDVGCAAVVLKPTLLGMELSLHIARVASQYGVSAVFSSSFESGIGLGYTAMFAALINAENDSRKSPTAMYAHGLGTFRMISEDIISPPFAQFVNEDGEVEIYQLSRVLSDLSLEAFTKLPDYSKSKSASNLVRPASKSMFAISSQVKGRTITLYASLSLPFSDTIARDKFIDLPQMPRWSPWLKSVEFISASESEWKLDVLGRTFSWRAKSSVTSFPKGIIWESLSGLRNSGIVEFVPISENSCTMTVSVSFLAPRGIERLFEGIFEDFLRNKLLKWSLEMFRDTVKGDLALERGDVELGDALSGAVEGRATVLSTAIEATLTAYAYNQTNGDFL